MTTNNHIARLKSRLDQAIIQRDHWKQLAARKNMLVIVEVDPDSRSTIEHFVTEDYVRAMWKRMESLAAQCDQFKKCLKYARTTMAVIADNAKLRGVEYRSLMSEVSRIDAALAEVKPCPESPAPTT